MSDSAPHIVLFRGRSKYDVLGRFIDSLAYAFGAIGCHTTVVDLTHGGLEATIAAVASTHVDAVVAMNNIRLQNASEGAASALERAPMLLYLTDHPVHYLADRTTLQAPNRIVSCVDRYNVEYLRTCLGMTQSVFIAHAGDPLLADVPVDATPRDIDLLMCGSIDDPDHIRARWRDRFTPVFVRTLLDLSEYALSVQGVPIHQVLRDGLAGLGISLDASRSVEWDIALLPELEWLVRCERRLQLLRALRGMAVHVYGAGPWERLAGHSGLVVQPELPFGEVPQVMRRSKIVLNSNPTIPGGGHERVFTAMLCGSVVLSDRSSFLAEEFRERREILFFDYDRTDEVADVVSGYLEAPGLLPDIAAEARERAIAGHTWVARAVQILDTIASWLQAGTPAAAQAPDAGAAGGA